MRPSGGDRSLLPIIDGPQAFARAFDVSRETVARLEDYAATLRLWQERMNLVSPASLPHVWHRHIADSAQLLALAPTARIWVDIGSGAGFPGLVIAIMLADRPGVRVHLVESSQKKCAFLREVARRTGAAVEIHGQRIELLVDRRRVANQHAFESVDIVTARALAPLDKLLGLARPLFAPATVGLFLKGRDVASELEAARHSWRFEAELAPSRTDPDGRVAIIRSITSVREG